MTNFRRIIILAFVLPVLAIFLSAGEIHEAAKKGDLEKIKALLEKDPGLLNVLSPVGLTPLHSAAGYGQVDAAAYLIKKGAALDIKDNALRTPLFHAVYRGHRDMVKLLLEKGASHDLKDNLGYSPLRWAAINGQIDIIDALVAKGAKLTLYEAAASGYKKMVEQLIAAGASLDSRAKNGGTALHWAVANRQKEIVELLLAKGAGINLKTKDNETALDLASERGFDEIAQLLRAKGGVITPVKDPEVIKLPGNIYRITFPFGMYSNIGVSVGTDGILLVDTGFSKRAVGKLQAVLKELAKGDIKYVINSHPHWDHITGNKVGGKTAVVFDYKSLETMLAKGVISKAPGPMKGKSGKTFATYYTMKFNGEEIRLIPYPGIHSDADWLIYFTGSGVAHMGDLLLSQSFPAVGQNVPAYMEFLEKVIAVFPENTRFICGHGKDFAMAGVKDYRKMLSKTIKIVKAGKKAGKSIEDMQKEKVLKKYEKYGELLNFVGPDYWIGAVYKSLEQPSAPPIKE